MASSSAKVSPSVFEPVAYTKYQLHTGIEKIQNFISKNRRVLTACLVSFITGYYIDPTCFWTGVISYGILRSKLSEKNSYTVWIVDYDKKTADYAILVTPIIGKILKIFILFGDIPFLIVTGMATTRRIHLWWIQFSNWKWPPKNKTPIEIALKKMPSHTTTKDGPPAPAGNLLKPQNKS